MVSIGAPTTTLDFAAVEHGNAVDWAHSPDAEGSAERAILDYGFAEGLVWLNDYMDETILTGAVEDMHDLQNAMHIMAAIRLRA